MDIKTMGFEDIERRNQEILEKLDGDLNIEEINALNEEVDALEARKLELKNNVEKRNALLEKVAKTEDVKIIEERKADDTMKDTVKYDRSSKEYRNAFLKELMGRELSVEERAFLHTTENTSAVIPESLENKIYSNMEEAHPILKDVKVLRTGTVIKITKHTAIVAGDAAVKGEGVANDDEENTFVEATLAGKKFTKHVDISYELEAMSIPAFEEYLANEIGQRLGAAMADDIVATIKTDLAGANKLEADTPGTLALEDILKAFASLKGASNVVVYANSKTLYGNLYNVKGDEGRRAFVDNYQDGIAGRLLGKAVKEEASVADGDVLIVDPKQFTWNEVRGITFERDRDIKKGVLTIAGHAIAEGGLTNDKAGAIVEVGVAA